MQEKLYEEHMPENLASIKKTLKESTELMIKSKTDLLCWQIMSVHNDEKGFQSELDLIKVTGNGSVDELMKYKNFLSLLDTAGEIKKSNSPEKFGFA